MDYQDVEAIIFEHFTEKNVTTRREARELQKKSIWGPRYTVTQLDNMFNRYKNTLKVKPANNVLYFDIETTDFSAGFGTMLMFSYCYHGERENTKLISLLDVPKYRTLPPEKSDYYLVQELAKLINDADIVCAHFGERFDCKFLQTRLLVHGLSHTNLKKTKIFDTWKVAKDNCAFGGNTLKGLSRALGCENQKSELPLHIWQRSHCIGYEPYFTEALEAMGEYCIQDTKTLYDIAQRLRPMAKHLPSFKAITGQEGTMCPTCGSTNIEYRKITAKKMSAYQEYQCLDCNTFFEHGKNLRAFKPQDRVMY